MVEEIVYTSAEKGLKQGSRGFCTVVSTAGMSLALAERLESMSGYRHAFPLHDPQASLNPVCFSHVTTRLAGKSLHVISRVADAGQDYTGRSNKLAHHLVIDNVASMPAGPARLMSEPGVIVERWDGNVRNVPPRELRCAPLPASIPLVAWQGFTGDEGWAGAVAEQLLQNPAPVSIIFNPGTDTLTLVREVLDLVPAAQRWNVTFSTYFTRLLAGAECQLRFVLNDTPEATSLRNDARARVIDLTSSLPAATGGTLVALARKGQLTPQEAAPTLAAPAVRARTAVEISTKDTGAEISIPKLKPGLSALETPDKPLPPRDLPPPVRVNSRMGLWIGVMLALIVVTVTGVLIFLRPAQNNDPFADLVSKAVPQDLPLTEAEKEAIRAREQAEKERRDLEERERLEKIAAVETAKKKARDEKIDTEKRVAEQQAERARQESMNAQAKAKLEAELTKEGPFAILKNKAEFKDQHGQWLFELPPVDSGQNREPIPLRLLKGMKSTKLSLSLCAAANPLFAHCSVKPEIQQSSEDPFRWQAIASGEAIAEYWLEEVNTSAVPDANSNCFLNFKWLDAAKREIQLVELLRWWPLQVDIDDRSAVFLQRIAFKPTTPLNWVELVKHRSFQFPVGKDVQQLALNKDLGLTVDFTVVQVGHPDITLTLPLSDIEPALDETKDIGDENWAEPNVANSRFFLLDVPFQMIEKLPDDKDALLGFGTFQIIPHIDGNNGLSFRWKMNLQVRIPSKEHLRTLPSPELIVGLQNLTNEPIRFFAEVAGPISDQNNADNGWPILQRRYDAAIKDMEATASAFRSSVDFWHSQNLQRLPSRKDFNSQIKKKAMAAMEEISGIIPQLKEANRTQGTIASQQRLKDAERYSSAISRFDNLLQSTVVEVDNTIDVLMHDYDAIGRKISEFETASSKFEIRVSLTKSVPTPTAESGKEIKIYILVSDSSLTPSL